MLEPRHRDGVREGAERLEGMLRVPDDREDLEPVVVKSQQRADTDIPESRIDRTVHAGHPPGITTAPDGCMAA